MELPVFQREYDSKLYSIEVYFLSKTLAEVSIFIHLFIFVRI